MIENEILVQFKNFLYKPMSRGEFLKHLGILILSLMGIMHLLKSFNLENSVTSGYGSTNYGGKRGGVI